MPTPNADETEKEFVDRCIPIVIEDGTAEDGSQAAAVCHGIWRDHKKKMTVGHDYLLDQFVVTKPGIPYRLFPFGELSKSGVARDISPESAATFKLPHFKPPIKLGSHEDETPAGGHIVGLEVREDGLYALPEWTLKGERALEEGDYRYHSPEVIWEDGGLETPDGGFIPGPLILGDALLHTPHLGEAAALYSVEPVKKTERRMSMTDEMVSVPKGLFERFTSWLDGLTKPVEPPEPEVPEEFKAAAAERDALKAEKQTREAEAARVTLMSAIAKEFEATEFGMAYIELGKAEEAGVMLAGMTEEQRAWCLRNFKAMSKQIAEAALIQESGSEGKGTEADPRAAFDAAVTARMVEKKIGYLEAYQIVKGEQADLFKLAFERKPKA